MRTIIVKSSLVQTASVSLKLTNVGTQIWTAIALVQTLVVDFWMHATTSATATSVVVSVEPGFLILYVREVVYSVEVINVDPLSKNRIPTEAGST